MVMNCFLVNMVNLIINLHYSSLITASVAIVRSRENSHHWSIVLPLVTFHNKLVGPCNEVKIVDVGELFRDVLPESVTSAPWRNSPATPTQDKIVGRIQVTLSKWRSTHNSKDQGSRSVFELTYHRGLTTQDHTWAPRGELPVPDPNP